MSSSAASARPDFVQNQLLKRDVPPLMPKGLTSGQNPPWSAEVRSQIADLQVHPRLESCLHLMNDDLFSAHFLLRKMQEDDFGKWLHACLHLSEGDLEGNAKLWYEQVDPSVLSIYWGQPQFGSTDNPAAAAHKFMYDVQKVHLGKSTSEEVQQLNSKCRNVRWNELVAVMEDLERRHGWSVFVNGKEAYTGDELPSHTSNILGEGWRKGSPILPKA